MASLLEQTLCYVAEEQFESVAFMFPAPADPGGAASAVEEWTTVSVAFTGPFGGRLCMGVPSAMLPVLGSNMYGTDEKTPSRARQRDALREMIDLICSHLLSAIAGDEAVFRLETPELLGNAAAPQMPGDVTPAAATRVHLDEGVAELWLAIDPPVTELNLSEVEGIAWVAGSASQQG